MIIKYKDCAKFYCEKPTDPSEGFVKIFLMFFTKCDEILSKIKK